MLEVVFGQSAEECLEQAQRWTKGSAACGAKQKIYKNPGAKSPGLFTRLLRQKQAEQMIWHEWQEGIPLGGAKEDICCFPLMLSMGSIGTDVFGTKRGQALNTILQGDVRAQKELPQLLETAKQKYHKLMERSAAGEPVRIWFGAEPDDQCGLCWFCAQLHQLPEHGPVILMELPLWVQGGQAGTFVEYRGWGEMSPGKVASFLSLQTEADDALLLRMHYLWKLLVAQNAPLRVCLNGRLTSAPAEMYDPFIRKSIEVQPQQFHQAQVIGQVMTTCPGVSERWVFMRMEEMIRQGELKMLPDSSDAECGYRRMLSKV